MNNITNFTRPTPLGSTYTLHHINDDGSVTSIELDGGETVTTTCPQCGRDHAMELDAFSLTYADPGFNLYGTMIYCEECSEKRRKERGEHD